jgi:hypothetical protein
MLARRTLQLLGMATGGGQIIRRLARKKMALPETAGTACFEYGVRLFCVGLDGWVNTSTSWLASQRIAQKLSMTGIHRLQG